MPVFSPLEGSQMVVFQDTKHASVLTIAKVTDSRVSGLRTCQCSHHNPGGQTAESWGPDRKGVWTAEFWDGEHAAPSQSRCLWEGCPGRFPAEPTCLLPACLVSNTPTSVIRHTDCQKKIKNTTWKEKKEQLPLHTHMSLHGATASTAMTQTGHLMFNSINSHDPDRSLNVQQHQHT